MKKNEGKPLFNLHDGPPFSNATIYGSRAEQGPEGFHHPVSTYEDYNFYIPGWDNHGMPIESAIIKQNKLDRKAMSVPEFRTVATEFA